MSSQTITKDELWQAREAGKSFETLLEDDLNVSKQDILFLENTFENACKQWSQLVAWSWLNQKELFEDSSLLAQAEKIQADFKAAMHKQAHENSQSGSQALYDFLVNLQKEFEPLVEILSFAKNLNFVFARDHRNDFYLEVNNQTLNGYIRIDTDQEYDGKKPRFTIGLPYPEPDPTKHSEYLEWMKDTGPQILPPPYLPTSTF